MNHFVKLLPLATGIMLATAAWAAGPPAGNAAAGQVVFKQQCAACHAVTPNAGPGVGPRLFGVVNRRAGAVPGYAYSPAMKASGLTWNARQLRLFLDNPAKTVKGNKMPYAGLHDPAKLDNVIAYLATLK